MSWFEMADLPWKYALFLIVLSFEKKENRKIVPNNMRFYVNVVEWKL